MKKIIEKLENANISLFEYKEQNKLCGFELNTYTNCGVNQIIFVDFRDTNKSPKKAKDFKELFLQRVESIDVDEEIETNRYNEQYRKDFTIRESLEDFDTWKEKLVEIAKNL
jgi:hypothetical protein